MGSPGHYLGNRPAATAVTSDQLGDGAVTTTKLSDDAVTKAKVGSDVFASQAEQETGSAVDVAVTPGRQKYHPSAAKAWVYWTVSGGTPTIQGSFNVSSITDGGAGLFQINFTTAFSGQTYGAVGSTHGSGVGNYGVMEVKHGAGGTLAAGSCPVRTSATSGSTGDMADSSFVAFGDQA